MIRILAASAALFLAQATSVLASDDVVAQSTANRSVLDVVGAKLDASAEIRAHHSVCPADIAGKARPLWRAIWSSREIDRAECDTDLEACYRSCMSDRNEEACFSLGLIMEAAVPAVSPHWGQALFAQACAGGSEGGCTNRGAGIRNGQYEGDPMLNTDVVSRQSCWFRTFAFSCAKDDAWGCTMLGQSYQFGEGTRPDAAEATRFYTKSCTINDDFPACDFARSQIDSLK